MPATALSATSASLAASQLVEAARGYSQEAWAHIFDSYYPRVFQYCYLRTNSRATAEDLASDVFLEALRGIRRYEYRGVPLLAWLYRIARNLTADHLRRNQRWRTVPLADDAVAPAADRTDASVLHQDIYAAMRQLTDEQQQVIVLRFFQGFSHEETAALMGRRAGAVRALQHRALEAMRRILAGPARR